MPRKKLTTHPTDGPESTHVVYSGFHKPTGETWLILGIDTKGDRVCAAGWPPTIGKLSDCENIEELRLMTVEEYHYRRNHFGYRWDTKRNLADFAKLKFYKKLLVKLTRIASGEMTLADYLAEVGEKVERIEKSRVK